MNPQDYKIIELIPHRSPMIMIDKLIRTDEKYTLSSLVLKEDNIFCKDGYFTEPGLIENIAQTAAARAGYLSQEAEGDVRLGYIGNIKKLKINFLPKVGSEIFTEVIQENQILGVTFITGRITCCDKLAVECEMKIFLK